MGIASASNQTIALLDKDKVYDYNVPCPCGRNNHVVGSLKFKSDTYKKTFEDVECSSCKRGGDVKLIAKTYGIQIYARFEFHYKTVGTPEYWDAHTEIMRGCATAFDGIDFRLPKTLRDGVTIVNGKCSCWWENRLGIIPAFSFKLNSFATKE